MEKPKTITQQIQEVADDFCNNYCKYPDIWDEEKEGCELSESDYLHASKNIDKLWQMKAKLLVEEMRKDAKDK